MKYVQSRRATELNFIFEENSIEYRMQDNNSDISFDINYSKIPKRSQVFKERNEWLRNVGYIWIAIGLFFTALNIFNGSIRMNFWLPIGIGCLIFYRQTWSDYTYYDTEEGRILILQDNQHDAINDEILNRRKSAFINWFNKLEFDNFEQFKGTLEYMVDERIFSKEELEKRLSDFTTLHNLETAHDTPPKLLN